MDDRDIEFFKTFTLVLVALAVIGAVAMWVANQVVGGATNSPLLSDEAIAERVAPVGKIRKSGDPEPVMQVAEAKADAAPKSAKEIVDSVCAGCHASGVLDAPKLGDKAAWEPRVAAGVETLYGHAINGLNNMPARGGAADLSDEQIKAAVGIMLQDAGFSVGSPAAAPAEEPQAATPAAEEAAPATEAAPAEQAVAASSADGEAIYKQYCSACHMAGIAGAPKKGDNAAWEGRKAQGMDTLLHNALNGIRAMPPRGTCMSCGEAELKAAIGYMAGS